METQKSGAYLVVQVQSRETGEPRHRPLEPSPPPPGYVTSLVSPPRLVPCAGLFLSLIGSHCHAFPTQQCPAPFRGNLALEDQAAPLKRFISFYTMSMYTQTQNQLFKWLKYLNSTTPHNSLTITMIL